MYKYFFGVLVFFVGAEVSASNTWYFGNVTQISTLGSNGSFVVKIDNSIIKASCIYDRINFSVTDMGAERTKAALSLAMTALASGKEFGIVVDLDASSGSICNASSTTSLGASIKN